MSDNLEQIGHRVTAVLAELREIAEEMKRLIPKFEAGTVGGADLVAAGALPERFEEKSKELRAIHLEMPKEQWEEFTARCRDSDPNRLRKILDILGLPLSEGGLE